MKKISKKDLLLIADEARRRFLELPDKLTLINDNTGVLSEGERLSLCYLYGCLLTLNKNNVLCDGWEEKFSVDFSVEDSEPITEG